METEERGLWSEQGELASGNSKWGPRKIDQGWTDMQMRTHLARERSGNVSLSLCGVRGYFGSGASRLGKKWAEVIGCVVYASSPVARGSVLN